MESRFSWLDYSDHEQRKMLDVISLLKERDTRDELGIGIVRDALSDLLFPGTSTIQTRARYFLFVPWIYMDLQQRRKMSGEVSAAVRQAEIKLIDALSHSKDNTGTIGIEAGAKIKRLPSNIYWQGLRQWDILKFSGSEAQFYKKETFFISGTGRIQKNDDGELIYGSGVGHWDEALPPPPDNFLAETSFSLTKGEASYLHDKIVMTHRDSLLAFLVQKVKIIADTQFVWELPVAKQLPSKLKNQLRHAQIFSTVMHGAALLYNFMLAEKSNHEKRRDEFHNKLCNWMSTVQAVVPTREDWNMKDFWDTVNLSNPHVQRPTEVFINEWVKLALSPEKAKKIAHNTNARRLIRERERRLKGAQARLENTRCLELWNGAAGTRPLDFRWRVVKTIVSDILEGLA